jgi:hypothetical protein
MKLIKFALWFALAGISYGMALKSGWVFVLGIAAFFSLLAWSLALGLIRSVRN